MIALWHNPRCSKSRQALALLQDAGADVQVRRYLEDAPSADEIEAMRQALGGIPAMQMMRTGEKLFRELGLAKDMSDVDAVAAMAAHPILIERPLASTGTKAVIGRPPEDVLQLV
ncbi:Arsenate reductase [Sulfitobacter noctilucae]|uniref:arsenate reductase (glutaredoxin) n=1 Tax=Sulfitobacter noctilucae TaxID=1342302 RepID=UPI000468391B|nr:arsenate reductase (glutaredoxin) [Sulfitobacter noctilucae]KIN70858.1 Arsenate reductase [Sulfitobacter noctilucae]